jgi:hypothetical protein
MGAYSLKVKDRKAINDSADTLRRFQPQPKRNSLCPPCFAGFNTERAEHLGDLCVEALPATENAEKGMLEICLLLFAF